MRTVVMTGGTAGLGYVAARRILAAPDTRLLLGARTPGTDPVDRLPLDLARLGSVREFARAVRGELDGSGITALVLNAGVQLPTTGRRTEDGYEEAFAVNHLAHYLLLRLLVPELAPGATVVLTTSDTHDPASNPKLAPTSIDPELLAHPPAGGRDGFVAGFRAYAASKLANLLTARTLAASPEAAERRLTVVAYNPGFLPETSLFRAGPRGARLAPAAARLLRPVAGLATVEQAGGELADLALGRTVPPTGRVYASLVRRRLTWPDPSELARRDDVADTLWRESALLVGLADAGPDPT